MRRVLHNSFKCTTFRLFFSLVVLFFHVTYANGSIVEPPDSVFTKIRKDTITKPKGKKVLQSNSKSVQKVINWFTKKDILSGPERFYEVEEAPLQFTPYAGKTIQSIKVVRLKPFGYRIEDTTYIPRRSIQKLGNSTHILTSKRLVLNSILFKEGDKVNAVDFAESEQLLRAGFYFEDVRIIPELVQSDTNSVRITIITKDVWTLSAGVRIDNAKSNQIALQERNMGGYGVGLLGRLYYDADKPGKWGYWTTIQLPYIGKSYIDGSLWYRRGLGYDSYYLNLKRDFYSSKAKYAFGATYRSSLEPYRMITKDSIISVSYKLREAWLGRTFRVSRRSLVKPPINLSISAKVRSLDYFTSPEVGAESNPYFHNVEQLFGSVALSNQSIFRSSLIYSFGSTEDIPVGFKVQATSGIERSQFQRRFMVGSEMSAAEITPVGYLYLSMRLGGYLAEGPALEQAEINIQSNYISNLFFINNTGIRQFLRLNFTRGISRFDGEREYIDLENRSGVRGLYTRELIGQARFFANFETVAYSPHYFYGFRSALFLFCDLGLIGPSSDLIYNFPLYSGFGLGLRLKNESLIFPTFLIRFGYYPRIPSDGTVAYWLFSTEQRQRFEDFRMKEPALLSFE